MNKKRIKVVVATDGSVTITPEGYSGSKCKDATKALEKALGRTESVKHTSAWSIKEAEPEKVRNANSGM